MIHLFAALSILLAACRSAPPATLARQATAILPNPATQPAMTTGVAAEPTPQQSIATKIDAYLGRLVQDNQFSGSVLVARRGQVLVSKGYGMANLEQSVPNTPQTKFRIGSVTKQFTAMAILLLQQQGKLKVQDHICTYIPQCPDAWQEITIHHLLTHTSGIRNFIDMPTYQKVKTLPSTPIQTMALFKDTPLLFKPGARYSYSNSGYVVLGYIIEKVSKKLYPLFLREQIFAPLQMRNTGYDTSIVLKHRAAGYTNGGQFNADYVDLSIVHAAGGLYSTIEDLYLWDQALYTAKLVPQAALDTMFTAHAAFPPPGDGGYGYGWDIFKAHDRRVTGHLGGIAGFSAGLTRFPDDKVTVIVLSNFEEVDTGMISMHIAEMVFKER
jgi:CubicO group peptidase (beta-lactamase class C family)